jgi:glycyl-tRNA synthetase alpha chain
LEITQFTYFQQAGGIELFPVPVEITYGLERLEMFLEEKDNLYDLDWSADVSYRDLRLREEREFSEYNFNQADIQSLQSSFALAEAEAAALIDKRLLLPAYDMCLKCSHLFNLLDARGAVSVTERVKLIGRIRALVNAIAARYCGGEERS